MENEKIEVVGVISESDKENKNIIISSPNRNPNILPFFMDEKYVMNDVNIVKFIKNVEMQVRTSLDYKAYIRYLKEDLGLNHCMIYSNITDVIAPIEMHHHIFTLYDIVEIILGYCFKNKIQFSSSKIFGIIMEEHRLNNILVVMLSQAVHIDIHNKNKENNKKFIDYRMCHGNIVEFLKKYYTGLSFNHLNKIKQYMDEYTKYMKNPPEKFFDECITIWTKEVMI